MKQVSKLTLSAMMASLATAFMLLSYFPYLTYAIPAMAGLFIMVLVIEIDVKWAFAGYLTSAVLTFLFAEPESKLMYIFLFGFYPIVKALIEKLRKPVIEWIIKLCVFLASVLSVYYVFAGLFGITLEDIDILGKYGIVILLASGAVVFVLYDIAVSRMAMMYMHILHTKIKKIFK